MGTAQTVTGAIDVERLGFCQCHEHLCVKECPGTRKFPALLIDDMAKSRQELLDYRTAGGRTILDAQPAGAGRDAAFLRDLSAATGVAIVTVTGFHLPHFYEPDHWTYTEGEDALTRRFLDELYNGCAEARDVRPGAVKAALGAEGCTGRTETKLRAAANAAAEARVPLVVHTEMGEGAVKAVSIAQGAGVPVQKILICHADRQATDFTPHDAIADTGAMLEYDTIGRFKYHDDEQEYALITHMLLGRHGGQLLLSLDTTNRRLARYGGEIGLTYLIDVFLPALRRYGVTEDAIRQMTIENPKKVFA